MDDEAYITAVLKIGLHKFDFDVDVFNNPFESLSHFKPNYYDEIVLDIRMPGMMGFELARRIWARPESQYLFLVSI